MRPQEKLQMAYELAFHPERLDAVWSEWEKGPIPDLALLRLVLDWALTLHQRLPEAPAASGRGLRRLGPVPSDSASLPSPLDAAAPLPAQLAVGNRPYDEFKTNAV